MNLRFTTHLVFKTTWYKPEIHINKFSNLSGKKADLIEESYWNFNIWFGPIRYHFHIVFAQE